MKRGRPPVYKTPEEMQDAIDKYFESKKIVENETLTFRPTMSGLANSLGISTRSLINYKQKDEFLPTIKNARQKVEEALEDALYGTGVAGVIFNLKNNFGWKDKQEIESNNKITVIELQTKFDESQCQGN